MGVTGIFFKQKLTDFGVGSLPVSVNTSAVWGFKSDLSGVGFKVGSEFGWRFWKGFSLNGIGAAVVAMASYDNTYPTKSAIPSINYPNFNVPIRDRFHLCLTGYQAALGFLYEKCFGSCKLDLKLNYEMIVWNNLPIQRTIMDIGVGGVPDTANPFIGEGPAGGIAAGFQGITAGFDLHF